MKDFSKLTIEQLKQAIVETTASIEKATQRLSEFAEAPDTVAFRRLGESMSHLKDKLLVELEELYREYDNRKNVK